MGVRSLAVSGALTLLGCHHASQRTAVAAAPVSCAGIPAPDPGTRARNYRAPLFPPSASLSSVAARNGDAYPMSARVRVDSAGRVDSIEVLSGDPRVAQGFVNSLRGAHPRPATVDGCPVTAWTYVDVR